MKSLIVRPVPIGGIVVGDIGFWSGTTQEMNCRESSYCSVGEGSGVASAMIVGRRQE